MYSLILTEIYVCQNAIGNKIYSKERALIKKALVNLKL